ELREVGLHVGVTASPVLPGITDGDGELERVAEAAKAAGAEWFFSGVLFLMPASAKHFLPFVREKFPRLAKQYEEWYAKNGYAPEGYQRRASERVARIRAEYGFSTRQWEERNRSGRCAQMSLGLNSEKNAAVVGSAAVEPQGLRSVKPARYWPCEVVRENADRTRNRADSGTKGDQEW